MVNDPILLQHFHANRAPVGRASTLPAHCYTSEDWHRQEIDKIFMQEWLCVGRESQIGRNGDYFTLQIGREPIVVLRDHRGMCRAFINVCRHRSAKIASGTGNVRTLVCKYHCWTYSLEGELLVVPGKPNPMQGAEGFDRRDYGLVPLRLERWGGFLFVNFAQDPQPLARWLGDLPEFLRNYRLDEMAVDHELAFDVDVNWKVFVENSMESYHAGFLHSKFLSPDVDQAWKFLETRGPYEAMYSDKSILDFGNLPPIEGLADHEQRGFYHVWLHPNTTIHLSSTYMTYRRYLPVDATRMRILYQWCFLPVTRAHPEFAEVARKYYRQSEEILGEDVAFVPNVQQGLSSAHSRPGRYSPSEFVVHKLANYVIERVAGAVT